MEERDILFSIIIPTYNRASSIRKAIMSVLKQTYPFFEVLVVDDGSTDHTEELVCNIKDSRVKYFKKENEERNIARNFGISKAEGNYVGFLDSDDYYYSHHLEEALNLIQANGSPEFLHMAYEARNMKGDLIYQRNSFRDTIDAHLINENLLSSNGVLIRADIAKEHNFLKSRNAILGEDHFLWLKLASRYDLHYSNVITSVVIEHEERSLRAVDLNKLIKGNLEIVTALERDAYFKDKYGYHRMYFYAQLYTLIGLIASVKTHTKIVAVRYLGKAVWTYPLIMLKKRWIASIKHLFVTFG